MARLDTHELVRLLLDRPDELQVVLMIERRPSQEIAAPDRFGRETSNGRPAQRQVSPPERGAGGDSGRRGRLAMLTPREREILDLLVEGRLNKVIAYRLSISPRTVEAHRAQIMRKLNARNIAELVRIAVSDDGQIVDSQVGADWQSTPLGLATTPPGKIL
ncbi:MAG: LuxR C-terminal-related transcriptional regulator [Rhizomicrobium sp.]